jgi:hypothetical protein
VQSTTIILDCDAPMQLRRRKCVWLFVPMLPALSFFAGCIRFPSDTPGDAGADSGPDITLPPDDDAGDAPAPPPAICERFSPSFPSEVARDVVHGLLEDCRIQHHFTRLPVAVRLTYFEECFTSQIGSVLGCMKADGEPFKYPALRAAGVFCRDMKRSHDSMQLSDGDFDAFVDVVVDALQKGGDRLTRDETMKVRMVFNSVRGDIVKLKDAGPTASTCDGGP